MTTMLSYIDPGSGSLIIQVAIATIIAVPFFLRRTIGNLWHRIRRDESSAADTSRADRPDR